MGRTAIGLAVLAVALAVTLAAPPPAAAGSGKAIGAAFRAFEAGDYKKAAKLGRAIDRKRVKNPDYVAYVIAQSAYLSGDYKTALGEFRRLAGARGSRFHGAAAWRIADCQWMAGDRAAAVATYRALLKRRASDGDPALARFRIAEAAAAAGKTSDAIAGFTWIRVEHPAHPLESAAEARLVDLGGEAAAALSPAQHLSRAHEMTPAKQWHEALAELAQIGDDVSPTLRRERDFWTGMTLFKMRRQYQRAADILLALYKDMGDRAPEALFHGARALSRADKDALAITFYQRVVKEYPRAKWAAEAQFLSGWLEFNLGRYKQAVPYLDEMRRRFPKSRWADDALWYRGFSHYLLGEHDAALTDFKVLARQRDRLEGGKGQYWQARSLAALGKTDEAIATYRALVGRYPLSWYALLSRARLGEAGATIDPFGDAPRSPDDVTAIAARPSAAIARDVLLADADELIDADLGVDAGIELERGEKAFIKRHKKDRADALATLMDTYRRAGNFNRPWMLAVVYGGHSALDTPPTGRAKAWWQHAFPLAFKDSIERWRSLGDNPEFYLYSIMRKESGFDPHDHSYANAIGLLQMIPATTRRVCAALGIPYTADLLYQPDLNIRTGAWYIGHLLGKFKGQIPYGAGSFNSGPRPVMRWLDQFGDRPADEFVELVPYSQTREYMKKVTEIYARYLYLYRGEVYEQPLTVDRNYVKDTLTY